jgi:hypothetical protein
MILKKLEAALNLPNFIYDIFQFKRQGHIPISFYGILKYDWLWNQFLKEQAYLLSR